MREKATKMEWLYGMMERDQETRREETTGSHGGPSGRPERSRQAWMRSGEGEKTARMSFGLALISGGGQSGEGKSRPMCQ